MNKRLHTLLYILVFLALVVGAATLLVGGTARPVSAQSQPTPAATSGCWSAFGHQKTEGFQTLTGVSALSDSDVWAVGYQGNVLKRQTLTNHWDGKTWSVVPSPNKDADMNTLSGVAAISANDAWAVGSSGPYVRGEVRTLAMHWNGQAWDIVPSPSVTNTVNELKSVAAVSREDVWTVGSYTATANGHETPRMLILHWDGSAWTQVATPELPALDPDITTTSQLNAVTVVSANDVWAVGYVRNVTFQPLTLHWDGTAWSIIPTPNLPLGGILYAASGRGANDIWAVGTTYGDQDEAQQGRTLTLHWNGSAWTTVPSPSANLEVRSWSVLTAVTALPDGKAWAVGYYYQYRSSQQPLLMLWDGQTWSLVSSPIGAYNASLYAAVSTGDILYVAGSQSSLTNVVLRYTSSLCASPTPIATMTPPVPLPGEGGVTFPETGKTLSGLFLDYWKVQGNLAQQGYPITNLMGEISDLNGKAYTMQYFERAVFEYHPENQPPYNVLLSQLGTFEYRKNYGTRGAPNQRPDVSPGSVLVPETGKRMGGRFLKYWQENGGLMQQGYPLSDEFEEVSPLDGKTYTVQYFERAVFEYHPENQPPFDVLLSHLGKFRYNQQYSAAKGRSVTGAENVGNVVARGRYIFWENRGLPNNPILGYDIESGAQMTVTDQPGYKFEMATDGIQVAWVTPRYTLTQSATLNTLHLGTGVRSSIPITSSVGGLALENGVLYYNGYTESGKAIYAHNIATGNRRPLVVRPFRVLPNGSRTADVLVEDIRVRDGVLLWREGHHGENSPPVNYERSLHMLKLDGTQGDALLASAKTNLRGFEVSGDNVVWAFSPANLSDPVDPSYRVTLYNIRTGVKKILSPEGTRVSGPTISGNFISWAEGRNELPVQSRGEPAYPVVKVHEIDNGSTYTLFRQSTYVAPHSIVGGNNLLYMQNNPAPDTVELRIVGLR